MDTMSEHTRSALRAGIVKHTQMPQNSGDTTANEDEFMRGVSAGVRTMRTSAIGYVSEARSKDRLRELVRARALACERVDVASATAVMQLGASVAKEVAGTIEPGDAAERIGQAAGTRWAYEGIMDAIGR